MNPAPTQLPTRRVVEDLDRLGQDVEQRDRDDDAARERDRGREVAAQPERRETSAEGREHGDEREGIAIQVISRPRGEPTAARVRRPVDACARINRSVGKRLSIALALLPLALAPGIAGAESAARDGGATAQAFALKVVVPGAAGAATTVVAAPVDSVSFGNAGAFPSMDVLSWGGSVASASASPATRDCERLAEVTSLSLFQGEVTATAVPRLRAGPRERVQHVW